MTRDAAGIESGVRAAATMPCAVTSLSSAGTAGLGSAATTKPQAAPRAQPPRKIATRTRKAACATTHTAARIVAIMTVGPVADHVGVPATAGPHAPPCRCHLDDLLPFRERPGQPDRVVAGIGAA